MYENVIAACKPYLGDQADSFLSRQCIFHLHTAPKDLTRDDVGELARWAEISGTLLIGKERAREMRRQIEAVSKKR